MAVFPFTLSVLGEFLGETHRGLPKLVRKRVNHAHHLGSPDARMRTLVNSGPADGLSDYTPAEFGENPFDLLRKSGELASICTLIYL